MLWSTTVLDPKDPVTGCFVLNHHWSPTTLLLGAEALEPKDPVTGCGPRTLLGHNLNISSEDNGASATFAHLVLLLACNNQMSQLASSFCNL
jgi:hypothetical protein